MKDTYGVVDIFAGPGGLAEGFSRVRVGEKSPFRVELSIDNDPAAHRTLRLRSFIHEFGHRTPDWYLDMLNAGQMPNESDLASSFPHEWERAEQIAQGLTLSVENRARVEKLLDPIKKRYGNRTILIGGPPCQVYSLAGRSRNAGNPNYQGELDPRHHLYREYIHILDYLRPAVFVMENVKGMLSSTLGGEQVFTMVRSDLESIGANQGKGYRLVTVGGADSLRQRALSTELMEPDHRDFVVRTELYGIPQRRHRVIVVGVRKDLFKPADVHYGLLESTGEVSVASVLRNMPRLRSGLSREEDSAENWERAVLDAFEMLSRFNLDPRFQETVFAARERFAVDSRGLSRVGGEPNGTGPHLPDELRRWLIPDGLETVPNNETRSHIRADLTRYLFASIWAIVHGRSPKASEFPSVLAPQHRNWQSGSFVDRFRVQTWDSPSATITSHISKDGHYFIHPDPTQCRSLTVREAARLQTFPDDYVFMGNRTEQYVQVGNAVPPYLAALIGQSVARMLRDV